VMAMTLIPMECLHFLFTGVSITDLGVMSYSALSSEIISSVLSPTVIANN
jgi:hypothetical protein